jgi:predicted DNA-binding transcriptional regulator AlpA
MPSSKATIARSEVRPAQVDIKYVETLTSFKRPRIYELMKDLAHPFPKPSRFGRSVRWLLADVEYWMEEAGRQRNEVPRKPRKPPQPSADAPRGTTIARRYEYRFVGNEMRQHLVSERHLAARKSEWMPEVRNRSYRRVPRLFGDSRESSKEAIDGGRRDRSLAATLKVEYEAGATADKLAKQHRMSKPRVLNLLRSAGTSMRPPGRRNHPEQGSDVMATSASAPA